MMKKIVSLSVCILLLCSMIIGVSASTAKAHFDLTSSKEVVKNGESFVVTVALGNDSDIGVAAFDGTIEYDAEVLELGDVSPVGNVIGKDFQHSNPSDGIIKFVYCEVVPLDPETTEFMDIEFTVLKDAPSGESAVRVTGGSLCDEMANDMTGDLMRSVSVSVGTDNATSQTTTTKPVEITSTEADLTEETTGTTVATTAPTSIEIEEFIELEEEPKVPPVVWVMIAVAGVLIVWFVVSKIIKSKKK